MRCSVRERLKGICCCIYSIFGRQEMRKVLSSLPNFWGLRAAVHTVEPLSADTPEIRTSTVLRTVREVPNEIPFTYVYLTPLKADTSLFRIADM